MIHLHTKSCWSLLESPFQVDEIIQCAKRHHKSYAALTDRNTMYGTMEFIKGCFKQGIQPIVGLEVSMDEPFLMNLILLAKNNAGLQDLYALSSLIMTRPEKNQKLSLEEIQTHARNCVVLSAGMEQTIFDLCSHGQNDRLMEILETLENSFEDLYISIAMNDSPRQRQLNTALKACCLQLDIKTCALSRIDYENPEDYRRVQMLQAIEKQTTQNDPALNVLRGRFWRSDEQMAELYDPQDLAATEEIAAKISIRPDLKATGLPVFQNKLGVSSEEYLTSLCKAGLAKRLNHKIPVEYSARLQYELDIILKMGFADYFLIVWDFIREARSRGILVGPGRGSAAGSLAAWCIGITHIDPIKNNLLFERFLNPERISMPDIDTDFPDDRRDEIIDYVYNLYGPGHVAHIVTFSTFKPKMALRDAGRVLRANTRDIDQLCKLVGNQLKITLDEVYEKNKAFQNLVKSKPVLEDLYQQARSIEGLPRHVSLHAGGIVFSSEEITKAAPLVDAGSHVPAVAFTMEHLEELGLIKFDFLGLKNLTIIHNINQMIEASTGRALDLFKLPLDDPQVYALLRTGQTLGIFQLESAGIRNLILQFAPRRFEDIAAILALYRPGPMQNIGLYLEARRNPKARKSLHPLLDDILAETGGIFLYQEQIMKAAQVIGGFSLAQADSLRKAMSKKNHEVMESWKDKFIQGAGQKNIPPEQAENIFDVMERFADYGFNKSHSYAYGLVVYWMAFMKTRYPLQFYACSLQGVISDKNKTSQYLQECRTRKIPVYGVSLNYSGREYSLEGNGIRMPFAVIKSTGTSSSMKILEERTKRGLFKNIYEAFARLLAAGLTSDALESLLYAGAFDEFGFSRQTIQNSFDLLVQYGRMVRVETDEILFAYEAVSPPVLEPVRDDAMNRLAGEQKVCGFYISEHPAIALRRRFTGVLPLEQVRSKSGMVKMIGRIASVHTHKTKNGAMMAFLSLEDEGGRLDAAVMPKLYDALQLELKKDRMVLIEGKKNRPESVLADSINFLTN